MDTLTQCSDLEDPLQGYTGLALFRRTLSSLPNQYPHKTYDPADLHSTHEFLKSMPLGSSSQLLEQAKAIIDGSSDCSSEMLGPVLSNENNDVLGKEVETRGERRPALGRKRARFSLKPNSSQPTVSLEPSLDIDKLEDPEEFFLAFERLENAKKELQKQTGSILVDSYQNDPSVAPRRRRLGILGRSVKYKHRPSTFMASQSTVEKDIFILPDQSSQLWEPDPNSESPEREVPGSMSKTENKVNQVLDELLTDDYSELDGDETVNLLQERLQIQPIDIEKLSLPDLHILRSDLKSSRGHVAKARNPLSDVHNLVRGITRKSPLKPKLVDSLIHSSASPTPPKSPFASISMLKKRMLQTNVSADPFSLDEIEGSPARSALPIDSVEKDSHIVDTGKESSASGKLKSLTIEDDASAADTNPPGVAIGDLTRPSDEFVNDWSSELDFIADVGPSGSHSRLDNDNRSSGMDNGVINDKLSRVDAEMHVRISGTEEFKGKTPLQDTTQEAMPSALLNLSMDERTMESFDIAQPLMDKIDKSGPAVVEKYPRDKTSKSPAIASPEHEEGVIQEPSRVAVNKKTKAKKRLQRESESMKLSRRQSLAVFGTLWEGGKRKSNRIRSRPLEYWKGERFLYGRIHDSLPTVIGRKYVSPAKGGGKPTVRVESFVSEKYKDLLDLAAQC
ncbi:hypothetical protein HS088_TW12G00330 [Tripterygium wilfordii]|uniref:Centromere protein C n=1 Tax=Tripterygium wilfordii TaxID=458696 RepID=A0A7J7CYJ2_TRIWF|nr:centromere protein C-like [Tripterygium wilfordii]KAF5739130.1 hypothetical protein HS088_TW12G00330 [Tripterygium wilfordii]